MGNLAVWKVLEKMVTDFKKRGIAVPPEIVNDLKSARTIIKVLKADPVYTENAEKIEVYLGNVESYLVSEGQRRFGLPYVEKWLRLIDEAGRKTVDEEEEETRFVSGMPREQKWIRVTPSKGLPLERLKTLIEKSKLSYRVQSDGVLVVFGPEALIKDFVKKIAARYKSKVGKEHQEVRNC